MRQTDIAIVGGGLAGSTAAAMLGRAGIDAILIDPHAVYPPDFRCEKLDGPQVRILQKTGLAEAVLASATHDGEAWTARFGRVIEKRTGDQYGIHYDTLVNTIRAEIPHSIPFIVAKVTALSTSPERQTITLSTGEEISARLIVLANGLNIGLRHTLGITREVLSPCHSVCVGFDIKPVDRPAFAFRALTYYAERATDQLAFLTLFPIGSSTRANLFVYRDMRDPWLRQLRETPEDTLLRAMPNLRSLTGDFEVIGPIKIRPADLYVTCPAAGTGTGKVFTDVERLCNVHIPRWLATEGMGEEKTGAFYDDPIKRAYDTHSAAKAYYLRSLSIEAGLSWRARRWGRFMARLGVGIMRHVHARLSVKAGERPGAVARTGENLRKPA